MTDTHHPQTTALVTGANKGLGLETVRRLAELGWAVWLGARDAESGEAAVRSVTADQPGADVRFVQLDVTSDDSVRAAYDVVAAAGGLDVLVNNAGIAGHAYDTVATTPADFLPVYAVNVLGPVRVTHAFAPLLAASSRARLVMVSSGLGTVAFNNDPSRDEFGVPGMVYQSSKSALNMIANQYAKALPDVRVASVDPGYTATDLNGHSGHQSLHEGTDAIVTAASADQIPSPHFDRHGPIAV
jgi:NAD(P)-dependent dehydrogenase (short-subunit alcohol dehydrogenase family)